MAHKLAIDIQDGTHDNRFMLINDLSEYDEVLGVKGRILQVLPPFTDEYMEVPFSRDRVTAISTNDLKLTDGDIADLPDGLYKFNFSVAPNCDVNIEFNHFRTATLLNAVLAKMLLVSVECTPAVDECGNVEINKFQNMLLHIWMLLKGAQAAGRKEHAAAQAKSLYDQAQTAYRRLYNIETCKMC